MRPRPAVDRDGIFIASGIASLAPDIDHQNTVFGDDARRIRCRSAGDLLAFPAGGPAYHSWRCGVEIRSRLSRIERERTALTRPYGCAVNACCGARRETTDPYRRIRELIGDTCDDGGSF